MRSRTTSCLAAALLAFVVAAPARAQQPLNFGFEQAGVSGPERPWGWTFGWSAFGGAPGAAFSLDDSVRHGGRRSLRVAGDSTSRAIMRQLPASFARGRTIRVRGWLRVAGARGRARLTLEAWGDRVVAAGDTASADAAAMPTWTQHDLTIRVPDDAAVHSVVVTASLEGSATAWFDDLELTVDGRTLAALPNLADPPAPSGLRWLAAHATPLIHVTPGGAAQNGDLAMFGRLVGDATIVGLGESTHGTREFFLVKHRLLEYLVRESGFTVFAIEANQVAVEVLNDYVQGGPGTAAEAMRVMFRVWNTEEMLALVEWLRAWNAAHAGRTVRFAGYDMQDHRRPADSLRAFLARVEPVMAGTFDTLAGEYRSQRSYATPQVADTVRARWSRQADALWRMVDGRRTAWLQRAIGLADTAAAEWAVQAANLLRQAAAFNVTLNSPERDSLMAANLDWFLRTITPGAKAVVWAHDVHVSRGGDAARSFNGGAQMGAFLARSHGDGYRAITMLTHSGRYSATASFTDHRMIAAEAFPAPAGSVEAALHGLTQPAGAAGFIVDLRAARTGAPGAWLRTARPIRHIGYAAYDYGFELNAVLPLEFDGIVFVDRTTASRLLN